MMKTYYFLLILGLIFMNGCEEEDTRVQEQIKQIEQLKMQAQKEISQIPYHDKQYQVFKSYFSQINNFIFALEDDLSLREPFNSFIKEKGLLKLCPKVFLPKEDWQVMMVLCRKNNFFLCPQEVRAYPDFVLKIRSYLNSDLRHRFDAVESCSVN